MAAVTVHLVLGLVVIDGAQAPTTHIHASIGLRASLRRPIAVVLGRGSRSTPVPHVEANLAKVVQRFVQEGLILGVRSEDRRWPPTQLIELPLGRVLDLVVVFFAELVQLLRIRQTLKLLLDHFVKLLVSRQLPHLQRMCFG